MNSPSEFVHTARLEPQFQAINSPDLSGFRSHERPMADARQSRRASAIPRAAIRSFRVQGAIRSVGQIRRVLRISRALEPIEPDFTACLFPRAIRADFCLPGTGAVPSPSMPRVLQRHHRANGECPMKLNVSHLGKRYRRDFWKLKDFSLEVGPGLLGLLGPNAAGKSTFMRMLATITRPTAGTISWNGVDIARSPDATRAVLGYLPQDFGVYPNLNAVEFLEYMAAIKGLDSRSTKKRIQELLQVVNLVDAANRPLGGYSDGMRQRVGIAQALLNDPQLLIVDEPTAGLDPEERVRFRHLLSDLSGNRIVILSTHIVSDVEATATHIVLIEKGTLLRESAPSSFHLHGCGRYSYDPDWATAKSGITCTRWFFLARPRW